MSEHFYCVYCTWEGEQPSISMASRVTVDARGAVVREHVPKAICPFCFNTVVLYPYNRNKEKPSMPKIHSSPDIAVYTFPLDHFGIVASPLIHQLVAQTGDKRKRKSALKALHQMAKSTKQIDTYDVTVAAGLRVDSAGQIWLFLETERHVAVRDQAKAKAAAATFNAAAQNALQEHDDASNS